MFEKALSEKLMAIFKLKKVTFDAPGEAIEQETLFIEVETSDTSISEAQASVRVEGKAMLMGPSSKIPFGYFAKAIAQAPKSLTKDFFFYDLEENTRRYRNLVQRGFSFVFFFTTQYDPEIGTITEVAITVEEPNS